MKVEGVDERVLVEARPRANFLLFIYEGGREDHSWSVDSYLMTDADLPSALQWLRENLPVDSCWSLAVVLQPEHPTSDSLLEVAWIVGSDVLNTTSTSLSPDQRALADDMLARRHHVTLP